MHSGQAKKMMLKKIFAIAAISFAMLSSCKQDTAQGTFGFKYPEQGQSFGLGEDVKVQLDLSQGEQITGVTYLVDGKEVASKGNADAVIIKTQGFAVGYKLVTAIVDHGSAKDTVTINIVLKAGTKPAMFSYKVVNVFPHDTSSYTQGLEYHKGRLLESTGLRGYSTLGWVNLETGKAIQKVKLEPQYFGEGATLIDNKIIMLSWQENIGFVFHAKSLQQIATFPYQNSREGWGLCNDGERLIKSDGTNRIYFLNKETYKEESAIDVYDSEGAVDSINEMEYINGKIYANVYTKNYVVVIDPKSGIVEQRIDFTDLLAKGYTRTPNDVNIDVLNGIAWDKVGKRLFITGKKWPKLFEVTLVPQ